MSRPVSLELHIWGSAFGLPSFDAECLAAVHYLCHTLSDRSWILVPSDLNRNPFQRLPALHDNGTWVAGLEQIQQYLSHISDGVYDLDHNLSDVQRAERDAYTSFLYSRGLPLLDLNFYVSSDNYSTITRRALSDLLTWPQSWVLPQQLRDQAKRRSDHLGLSELDVDAAQEDDKDDSGLTANIPKSLRKPRLTVSGLLGRNAQNTRFRLDAVIADFLEPIHMKMGAKQWLITDKISSVDCLAIAIINLMQVPEMPQAWLQDTLSSKYASLAKWAKEHASVDYGQPTFMSGTAKDELARTSLPWASQQLRPPPSWKERGLLAIDAIVDSIPILRNGHERKEISGSSDVLTKSSNQKQELYARMREHQSQYSQVVVACISATSVLGWMAYAGILSVSRLYGTAPSRRKFGEAGAILGL